MAINKVEQTQYNQGQYRHPSDLMALAQEGFWEEKDLYRIAPRLTIEELIDKLKAFSDTPSHSDLSTTSGSLPVQDMLVLSDMKRTDLERLHELWPSVPLWQRQSVVQQMIDFAQDNLEIHLGRFLRIALRDQDAAIRHAAIDGLWEENDLDLVGIMVQLLLNDPVTIVRESAAKKLGTYILAGELDEIESAYAMRTEEALLTVLHDTNQPLSVRCHALESLAYSGETGIRQIIEDGYYSAHEAMRLSAMTAMGRSADIRWRSLARVELQNPSPSMRAVAAQVCGELETRVAINDLITLIDDEAQEVRFAAIFALGRIGSKDAQIVLTTLAQQDELEEAEVAELALEELLFYADAGADISLFDETLVEEDDWEQEDEYGDNDYGDNDTDPWDQWFDINDDLGTYEE